MNYLELLEKKKFYNENKNKLNDTIIEKINKAFDIDFTYHSTTIEGNTLTLIETKAVIEDQISIGGKVEKNETREEAMIREAQDEMCKKYKIREIENKDNKAVEDVIRKCLIEFGANHAGTAWADPNLGRFSEIYNTKENKYWVAEDESGNIVGGVGIGKLDGIENVCELQKMYCLPEARGTGISHKLITMALDYAKEYYNRCYLETLENMVAAQKFYEKHGFKRIYEPIIKTEHFACDVRYIKELK